MPHVGRYYHLGVHCIRSLHSAPVIISIEVRFLRSEVFAGFRNLVLCLTLGAAIIEVSLNVHCHVYLKR